MITIISTAIHDIDHAKSDVTLVEIPADNSHLHTYIDDLLEKVAKVDSKRLFEFESTTGSVAANIARLFKDAEQADARLAIARRLLYKEQNAQIDNANLKHEIPKGFLMQTLFDDDGITRLIISKSDNSRYLNRKNLTLDEGLPFQKKTYKAFLADFDKNNEVVSLALYDTSNTIAKYWSQDFLELKEINTDEFNTNTAFDSIDKMILNKFKKEFPGDHNILRNRVIGYFRTRESFEMQDFIDTAIGEGYDPVNPGFKPKVAEIIKKLRELPQKKNFDSNFTIEKDTFKARQVNNVVALNDKIDLHIKDYVGDLGEIIKSFEENGVKYIRIKTDSGYKAFKDNATNP